MTFKIKIKSLTHLTMTTNVVISCTLNPMDNNIGSHSAELLKYILENNLKKCLYHPVSMLIFNCMFVGCYVGLNFS